MNMNFGANETPVEVIKEGAFRGICFRDIYSSVNRKWYNKSWKELLIEKLLIKIIIAEIIMILVLINMVLNAEHH